MRLYRYVICLLAVVLLSLPAYADEDDYDYDTWIIGAMGEWTSTNWLGTSNQPLPFPGYPGTNAIVEVPCGTVSVTAQDVTTVGLNIKDSGKLIVTNSRTVQLRVLNFHCNRYTSGHLVIADGTVNVLNENTSQLRDLVVDLGASGNGYLDLGAMWGATNGFQDNYGDVGGFVANVKKGGLRIDAMSVNMALGCRLTTYGQEVTFRGDWLNADTTTVFFIVGNGSGQITIGNDFSFGGCTLAPTLDTNGISIIQVGGDAHLTNVTIEVSATTALTNTATAYDLVRVPEAKTIYTNGMTVTAGATDGVKCAASLDLNRGGYDYLVLTLQQYVPSVAIIDPPHDTIVQSGTNVVIGATASDKDGTITKVEFYVDSTNKIGEVTNTPYSVTWTNVLGGSYDLKAVATDNNGIQAESEAISLGVEGIAPDGRKVFITGDTVITYDSGCAK